MGDPGDRWPTGRTDEDRRPPVRADQDRRPPVRTDQDRRPAGWTDERAVSTVVNYAMALVVVGLLATGLLIGASGYVDGQNERAVRSELSVVGNHLAADLASADRLAGTVGSGGDVELRTDLPDRVVGQTYLVSVRSTGDPDRYAIVVETTTPDASVTVYVRTSTPIETGRVHGGDLVIGFDGRRLEVADD